MREANFYDSPTNSQIRHRRRGSFLVGCTPEVLTERFQTARQQGRLRRLSQTSLPGASETVTIRTVLEELTRARTLAAKRGLRYQTYLKMLLHEALDADEKRLVS